VPGKRVIVIVNKWWECEPVLAVFLNPNARPTTLGWPDPLFHPRKYPDAAGPTTYVAAAPRAVFHLTNIDADVWCISDLLADLGAAYQSSTEKKADRLPEILTGVTPSLVIAAGTAGYPSLETENGSVVIGSRVFLHDGHPPSSAQNPVSQWHDGTFNEVIDSSLDRGAFDAIVEAAAALAPPIDDLLLATPLNPSPTPKLIGGYDWISLASLNVTDPAEYKSQDQATLDAFAAAGNDPTTAKSLDTTLALVRVRLEAPFIFAAGIVNRVGFAAEEMQARSYAQNTVGAHNAGIVLARLIVGANDVLA